MSWILLWKIMFVVVMVIFFVMACLVTVFGAQDIKKLIKALGKESKDAQADEEAPED